MLISKADIKDYTQFTLNIEDRIINHNILDAQEFDLKPTVGDLMYNKLNIDAPYGYVPWDFQAAYSIGNIAIYENIVYISLTANTGAYPNVNPSDWAVNELGTFFWNYLRPYLVFSSYGKFLLWAGTNLTQYGLVQIDEDTSAQVSDQRRAELITDVKQKMNVWLSRLKNQLCTLNWIFDSVNYSQNDGNYQVNPIKTFKIRPVGRFIKPMLPNNQKPMNQTEWDFYGN